jgi:NADH-quinone oxidoreductase subunit J
VIVYAGAIMVLFVFATMLIGLEKDPASRGSAPFAFVSAACFFGLLGVSLDTASEGSVLAFAMSAKQVSRVLYQAYGLAVELASFLLLAALIGAFVALKHFDRARPQ